MSLYMSWMHTKKIQELRRRIRTDFKNYRKLMNLTTFIIKWARQEKSTCSLVQSFLPQPVTKPTRLVGEEKSCSTWSLAHWGFWLVESTRGIDTWRQWEDWTNTPSTSSFPSSSKNTCRASSPTRRFVVILLYTPCTLDSQLGKM